MPTLSIRITAGNADNLIPNIAIIPKICARDAKTLSITNTAAHIDSRRMQTRTKATTIQHDKIMAKEDLKVMYCSQNINGMPEQRRKNGNRLR